MTASNLNWSDGQLVLSGKVTIATVTPLVTGLDSLLQETEEKTVTLDCHQMTGSDSSAIALMLDIQRRLNSKGITMTVSGLTGQLRHLIQLYGVDWILQT